ncbi:MAG: NAD(P)H-dependent glycerol-3-phosphate dehydrogenase, partial [Giesbergeria sp.]
MKIIVVGAGAWGTAVAISAAAHPLGHAVTLWARSSAQQRAMQAARCNARYLADAPFPDSLLLA